MLPDQNEPIDEVDKYLVSQEPRVSFYDCPDCFETFPTTRIHICAKRPLYHVFIDRLADGPYVVNEEQHQAFHANQEGHRHVLADGKVGDIAH